MIKQQVFYTERLALKILDGSYAARVRDYFQRNKEFLFRWEPIRTEEFYTIKFHRQLLKAELENIEQGSLFKVWVFKREDSKFSRVIGSVALNNIVRGSFQSCFLGYRLDKDELNQGYITEAVREVIRIAFTELKIHRVEANIIPENKPSLRVVEKLGFEEEGLARKYLKINGKWEDHLHMTILNEALE